MTDYLGRILKSVANTARLEANIKAIGQKQRPIEKEWKA
jgi:hypothetical protein